MQPSAFFPTNSSIKHLKTNSDTKEVAEDVALHS